MTLGLRPGCSDIQFEGRSIDCIPIILKPLKNKTREENNNVAPLKPGKKILETLMPALVFIKKTLFLFALGNRKMKWIITGGKLKP
jgi:hypothetical protein